MIEKIKHQAFKNIESPTEPGPWRVLLQLAAPRERSSGGILFPQADTALAARHTEIARIEKIGPMAFCFKDTGEAWPGVEPYNIGDIVRVSSNSGERFSEYDEATGQQVYYMLMDPVYIMARVPADYYLIKE